ncbi:MAG TPA: rhodanese-like domain-containing protein [Chitinophagaceae bacterium]
MTKQFLLLFSFITLSVFSFGQNNYKEISLIHLAQKVQQNNKGYVILDVRTTGEYMDTTQAGRHLGIGRIKTAVNVPLQDLLQKPETIKSLEKYKNEEVFVICSHSYRSRRISNLLLENGFTNVINVQGGMTEWYRNYQELQPYMASLYENNIMYHNMAPAELFKKLEAKENIEFIGFKNPPRFFFDSLVAPLYPVFPDIKNTQYFTRADSLQILEKVKANPGKTFVLFNTIGGGADETADWLTRKGYKNMNNLIGNLAGFFEYLVNYQPASLKKYFTGGSKIEFYTPLSFCKNTPKNVQWVDIRHDTTFNKITKGTKLDYKTLKGAVNFPFYKTADEFAQQFTDKTKLYMLIPQDGYTGVELAEALLKKGYSIGWLLSGIERWEWYTNNIPEFSCKDQFVK